MKLFLLLSTAAAAVAAPNTLPTPSGSASPPADHAATPATAAAPAGFVRLPGFAAELSEMPTVSGPDAWAHLSYEEAWGALAKANQYNRQSARWGYARSLIGDGLGDEALGVLDVMKADDPDLALVPSWRLARGAALTEAGRSGDALDALDGDPLAANPEACMWRMRAMAEAGLGQQALAQVSCAMPAINPRRGGDRAPFIIAASRAALDAGRPALTIQWLQLVADRDPAANLYRGRAYLALKQGQAARLRLDRVALTGDAEQRMDARLSTIEAGVTDGSIKPADALRQLDNIRFTWRGGDIEQRALLLTAKLSAGTQDVRRSLGAGATLVRYFNLGQQAGPTLAGLQAQFTAALAPNSSMPLDQAAGLYWEFRDLAPAGAEGDLLVSHLADRLQAAGLYGRAAELLQYQLTQRAKDVAQGPLSVKVASLYILAGRPDRALRALRDTDSNPYPQQMLWDRHRVEAAALHLLGQTAEAMAVLQDVPDGDRIRAEIYWKKQDWGSFLALQQPALPRGNSLNDVGQAMVLRQAIALAMLGREDGLARLRTRYAPAFAKLATAPTFDVLTRPIGAIDPAAVSKAMAAIPTASPAGSIADLIDADPAPARPAGA